MYRNKILLISFDTSLVEIGHPFSLAKIYTEVSLCDSSKLPYKDNAFDIAIKPTKSKYCIFNF